MPKGPVRRGQTIAPFGVGAMMVVRDGTSLIAAGLDHWFEPEDGDRNDLDHNEFIVEEWRLQSELGVPQFREAPEYRRRARYGETPTRNAGLTVPFLRFPQWHMCPFCKRLKDLPLTTRTRQKCGQCEAQRARTRYLVQVPFVAMCDRGHLQDFPWREYVHHTLEPDCDRPMRLLVTGGTTLADVLVKCDCGRGRDLAQIARGETDGNASWLSESLDAAGRRYLCNGHRPWHGTEDGSPCGRPLRGALRQATNLYYAQVRSAIYLPRNSDLAPAALIELLVLPEPSALVGMLAERGKTATPADLRKLFSANLSPYSDAQIAAALEIVRTEADTEPDDSGVDGDDDETAFRRSEFAVLRTRRDDEQLLVRVRDGLDFDEPVAGKFARIGLVEKLRETRVLVGFTRVLPEIKQTADERRALLWRNPSEMKHDWLPAHVVFGEGIFFEWDERSLQEWETRANVADRLVKMQRRHERAQRQRGLVADRLSPRFVLLHTFSHLLINQLTFDCGYSSASLRERLYVSDHPRSPMAGVLIYTAAGDSEGTMGGLVRIGKPGFLEAVVRRAIEGAEWCSADPVCMELGDYGGQGPDACNMAACHNCGLVPETACEQFNRFLDRGVVVGLPERRDVGFFV